MTGAPHLEDAEREAVIRDRDLALELLQAQPTHKKIGELARSVLAREPSFTGTHLVLALHLQAREELDEARTHLLTLIGMQDDYQLTALRILRDLEYDARDYAESLRVAEEVLRAAPEPRWLDVLMLGAATVFTGDREAGWDLMDEAVSYAGRTDPEDHAQALEKRAARFLTTAAPPARFLPAAEAAIAANPGDHTLSIALAYAYLYDYRAEEARELLQRVLREDPTNTVAQGGLIAVRGFLGPIERGDATMEDFRAAGFGESAWHIMHEQLFDLDIGHALDALDRVLPRALVRVLRGPLRKKYRETTEGSRELLSWHDGQDPGTGAAWGLGKPFRLLSHAEIEAREAAIEQHPEDWPGWDPEVYAMLIATDDNGGYYIEGYASRMYYRAPGAADVEIAPSLADWLWDRVVEFGGEERRPGKVDRG